MLEKYLNMVCSNSVQEVGIEFSFLGLKIWEKYIQIRFSYEDEDDLLKIG